MLKNLLITLSLVSLYVRTPNELRFKESPLCEDLSVTIALLLIMLNQRSQSRNAVVGLSARWETLKVYTDVQLRS